MKTWSVVLLAAASCAPMAAGVDGGAVDDAGVTAPDAGSEPRQLAWKKVADAPRSRSVHFAFFLNDKLWVGSGNHERGPVDDVFTWTPSGGWQAFGTLDAQCPERKNAGVAVDARRGTVVLFGGVWSGTPLGGQWESRILRDGCRFDGARFTALTGTLPPGRSGHGMVFDDARDEAVLFGGFDTAALGDTWVFKNDVWTQRTPATAPSARYNTRLVYDGARQVVLLFGGHQLRPDGSVQVLDDTWTWDGTTWRDVSGAGPRPPGRGYPAIAYDPVLQRVVMGGGALAGGGIAPGSALRDFWTWDGQRWARLDAPGAPPGRGGASLTYDPVGRRLLLFGGNDGYDVSDLWALTGSTWEELTHQPQPRSHFGLAQDSTGTATLFGGIVVLVREALQDTWRFEGGRWRRLTLTMSPQPRYFPAMAAHGETAVLFGGLTAAGVVAETWTLEPSATRWQWRNVPGPSARESAALGYDPLRQRTVLFGGRDPNTRFDDTWSWDGSAWTKLELAVRPPARSGAKLVFHSGLGKLVLLGGSEPTRAFTDAWTFDGERWEEAPSLASSPGRTLEQRLLTRDGRLAVFGGFDGTDVRGDTQVFEGGAWRELSGGPSPRLGGAFLETSTGWRSLFGSRAVRDGAQWVDWSEHPDAWELELVPLR